MWGEVVVAFAIYALVAVALTWPLIGNVTTSIPGGGFGWDPAGYTWDLWRIEHFGLHFWGVELQESIGAPFGREAASASNITLLGFLIPASLITSVASPIVAMNVALFSGLLLSAGAMHLLMRWLGTRVGAALWAGCALIMSPWMTARAGVHVPLVHIWCFPLTILVTMRWAERPTWRRAWWVALTLLATWLTNPYFGTIVMFVAAAVIATTAVIRRRSWGIHATLGALARVSCTVGLIVVVPLVVMSAGSRGALDESTRRDPVELLIYGAQIREYLVPAVDSAFFQAVAGASRWAAIGTVSEGDEHRLFVGFLSLALVALTVGLIFGRRSLFTRRQRTAVICSGPLVALLGVMSLASPQVIAGHSIEMPSRLLFALVPYLRAYSRFGIAVLVVLIMVAALGLDMVVRRFSVNGRLLVVLAAFTVSLLEFSRGAIGFPSVTSDVPVRINGQAPSDVPVWMWLREHPDSGIVLETAGRPDEWNERFFMYGQIVHGHRLANGNIPEEQIAYAALAQNGDPRSPGVAHRLAALGIGVVTVQPFAYERLGLVAPDPNDPPSGFRVLAAFPDGSAVWRVVAPPADGVALPTGSGWWPAEYQGDDTFRWMRQHGTLSLVVQEPGRFRISFNARGAGSTAPLLRVQRGSSASPISLAASTPSRVAFVADLPAGRTDVTLISTRPATVLGAGDLRAATVAVSDLDVRRVE